MPDGAGEDGVLFAGQRPGAQGQGVLQVFLDVAGVDGTVAVAGQDLVRQLGQGQHLLQGGDVGVQIPVGPEHVDGAALLHRVPGEQQPVLPVQEGHATGGVPRGLDDLQAVAGAGEDVPRRQLVELDTAGDQVPVRRMEPAHAEFTQAAGVIPVAVGEQHLHRLVRQGADHIPDMAVGEAGVDEQGLVLPHKQELPHPLLLQDVKIVPEFPRLGHSLHLRSSNL